MKRICFVTTVSISVSAFLTSFMAYIHENSDWEIYVICDNDSNFAKTLPEYIHYIPVPMKRGVSIQGMRSIRKMYQIFKQFQFDIVQYATPNASLYASIASTFARIPVRLYCQWGIRYMGFEGIKRTIFKLLEKLTCRFSSYIEVESHGLRQFALQESLISETNSCVILNGSASGVNLSKFNISNKELWRKKVRDAYSIKSDDVVFCFAARLTRDKGVNELLSAFLSLESSRDNAALLIIGGEDNISTIDQELLGQAKKSPHIYFIGATGVVEQYFAAADIFVAPSYREGFGLVVIEAGSMALPAIVSNVPGQVDAIIPNVTGVLCNVKDDKTLLESMELLLDDKHRRQEMGKCAFEWVTNNFEQEKLFAHLLAHRKELLRK